MNIQKTLSLLFALVGSVGFLFAADDNCGRRSPQWAPNSAINNVGADAPSVNRVIDPIKQAHQDAVRAAQDARAAVLQIPRARKLDLE